MDLLDHLRLSASTLVAHRLRTALSVLGIAIGIASVILLTSIGEGLRRYVIAQFTQFGTNLIAINPGKTETIGIPGVLGGTTRKLTIEDALALERIPGVTVSMPLTTGQARVEAGSRGRSVYVYGVTHQMPEVWRFAVRQGSFLPPGDPRRGAAVCVLGPTLKRELFGAQSALGETVRIGGRRFRVIGVMTPKGQMLGIDLDDAAYLPIAQHMAVFDLDEVWEIDILFAQAAAAERIVERARALLIERHAGEEDFTITTQAAMLDVFGRVLGVITSAVAAIGGISLVVGAVGILTMMWIAVGERTGEIGLVRALGATPGAVARLFLAEALALSLLGGLAGLGAGFGIAWLASRALPGLPVHLSPAFAAAALAVSALVGVVSGVLPARRAARLDPVEALRAE